MKAGAVKVDDREWRRIKAHVAKTMGSKVVKVGVVGASAGAAASDDDDGITIGRLAGVHEFGAVIQQRAGVVVIPERSFMRATVSERRRDYGLFIGKLAARVLDAKMTEERALGLLGARVAGDMQQRIADGIEPPNAETTVARKGSSTPLIDTGRLRQSLSFVVVDRSNA